MRFYAVIFDGERMANYKVFVVFIATIFIWGCSKTPMPIVKEEVQLSSQEDLEYLKQTSEGAPLEIDLYQAIAIAIKNNRDLRLNLMDSALSQGQIDVVKFDMLPKLSVNAGYKVLEKHPASTSVNMAAEKDSDGNDITGTDNTAAEAIGDSPTYTLSQQTPSSSSDIGFTWNALDLGLSYVREGQQANKYLI